MRNIIAATAIALFSFLAGCWVVASLDSASQLSEAQLVQELKNRGWQSSATDNIEALYFGDVNASE